MGSRPDHLHFGKVKKTTTHVWTGASLLFAPCGIASFTDVTVSNSKIATFCGHVSLILKPQDPSHLLPFPLKNPGSAPAMFDHQFKLIPLDTSTPKTSTLRAL